MKVIPFCIILILNLSVQPVIGQKKILAGKILDEHSEEGVPFASVLFKNTTVGGLTDSSGSFSLHFGKWPSDTLEITCVGYQPYLLVVNKSQDSAFVTIMLQRGKFNEGVQIKAKINKGLFLWRKIVQHKPENNRYRFNNFSYELYNKLELDVKNLNFKKMSHLKPFRSAEEIIKQNIDSTEGIKYLPVYLTEALSDYYYQKDPKKRREIIKAANTNGVKNESMIKFLGGTDQVVNVYNNFIDVADLPFVSPISDYGDGYYNYNVTDTQQMGSSRFYHLVFTPRRKGTNTFEGDCWVHAGTFAIQKMSLRLGKDANINFLKTLSMIQEYRLINDSVWFLAKDKFVADVSPLGKGMPGFIGRKTSTYKNVVVDDSSVTAEIRKNKLLEEIIMLPGANQKDKAYWELARHEQLSKTESGVIKMIDTLTNAPSFQRFTKTVIFIGSGYLNVGNYQIGPWMNWISYNSWEGLRLRFDLGTNKNFNKKILLAGYLAYGFNDKKFKGEAEIFYLPKKDPRTYLYASYTNDLDYGQNYYGEVSQDNIFALAIRKNNIPVKKIQIEKKNLEFFHETLPWMSNRLTITHTSFTPLKNLLPADSFKTATNADPLTSFQVTMRFRFAYLEDFLENNFYRTSLGSPYPIGEIYITEGFPGVLRSSYSYTKLSASISDYVKIPPVGNMSFQVYAGKTFGTLPYTLLDIAPGNELYYYNKYAFNMMNRYEFVHDQYAGINFEHNIGNGLFRLFPKLKFRQFWTAKALWGSLSDANKALNFKQGNTFQTLDGRTYLEMGTGIDNILHVFRLDFVWRLLPTSDIKETTKRFGVFGSFRLSF
jgi:Family of unknown function (DUF5686)/CarboxypepD_reg-like domain